MTTDANVLGYPLSLEVFLIRCRRLDDRFPQLSLIGKEPIVVKLQSLFEFRLGFPAHCLHATAVEQLAWRSVRSRLIIYDAPLEAHAALNVFGELGNRDVVAGADVDVRLAGIVT